MSRLGREPFFLAGGVTLHLGLAAQFDLKIESGLVHGPGDYPDFWNLQNNEADYRTAVKVAREASRDLDREVTRTRDLAIALKREVSHASGLVRERIPSLTFTLRDLEHDADQAGALARQLDANRAQELSRSLDRDGTLDRYLNAIARLTAVPIDVSGANMSGEDLDDPEVLKDVIWTQETEWPPGVAEHVHQWSREIRPGVYQVHGSDERGLQG